MAVRSFMTIVAAHAAAQAHIAALNERPTVVQGREHAPPSPSFNGRGTVHRGLVPLNEAANYGDAFADMAAARGRITPHQRYEIAMQRDIG